MLRCKGGSDPWGDLVLREAMRRRIPVLFFRPGCSRCPITAFTMSRFRCSRWPDRRAIRSWSHASSPALDRAATGARCEVAHASPPAGIDLATKRAVVRALLLGGASIQELNVVRKHLSRIKGAALARACRGRVLTPRRERRRKPTDVASRPSVSDPSTVRDARRILARRAPAFRDLPLVRTGMRTDGRRSSRRRRSSPGRWPRSSRSSGSERASSGPRRRTSSRSPVPMLRQRQGSRRARRSFVPPSRRSRSRAKERAAAPPTSPRASAGICRRATVSSRAPATASTGRARPRAPLVRTLPRAAAANEALARFVTGPFVTSLGAALPARPTGHNLADLHVLVSEVSARDAAHYRARRGRDPA